MRRKVAPIYQQGLGCWGRKLSRQWSNVGWCTFEEDVIALVGIITIMVQLAWKCASNSYDDVSERRRELEMLPAIRAEAEKGWNESFSWQVFLFS